MSKLYDVTVLGAGEPASWLAAAAFASSGLRVALVLREPGDSELIPFAGSLIDPSRSMSFLRGAGVAPQSIPLVPYAPDFQVIVGGTPLDFIAQPEAALRARARDLQDEAHEFEELGGALIGLADELISGAQSGGFPSFKRSLIQRFVSALSGGPPAWWKGTLDNVEKWSGAAPERVKAFCLAAAAGALSLPLSGASPALMAALGFKAAVDLHPGTGPAAGLCEQAANLISRRGAVMEAEAELFLSEGSKLHGLRLKGGRILDTRVLIGPARLIFTVLGATEEKQANSGLFQRIERKSWFFKMERETIPESLAPRAGVVVDPGREIGGENFLILNRSPRVPKRETLAVSLIAPPPDFDPETIPGLLASALPWLDANLIEPDDTRRPMSRKIPNPGDDFFAAINPRFPFDNCLPLPSEVLPAWGPLGAVLALSRLRESVEAILAK